MPNRLTAIPASTKMSLPFTDDVIPRLNSEIRNPAKVINSPNATI